MPALSGAAAVAFAVLLAVSLSGIGEHHTNTSSPESARILSAGASSTGTSAEAPAAPGAEAAAPTAAPRRPAHGVQIAADLCRRCRCARRIRRLHALPRRPARTTSQHSPPLRRRIRDQRPGASTGTSAGTPASTPVTDTANGPAKAVAAPSVGSRGPDADRRPSDRQRNPRQQFVVRPRLAALGGDRRGSGRRRERRRQRRDVGTKAKVRCRMTNRRLADRSRHRGRRLPGVRRRHVQRFTPASTTTTTSRPTRIRRTASPSPAKARCRASPTSRSSRSASLC